jgi:hypothetical protein
MREQYQHGLKLFRGKPELLLELEYETVMWERHVNKPIRQGGKQKGKYPDVVVLDIYKKVRDKFPFKD